MHWKNRNFAFLNLYFRLWLRLPGFICWFDQVSKIVHGIFNGVRPGHFFNQSKQPSHLLKGCRFRKSQVRLTRLDSICSDSEASKLYLHLAELEHVLVKCDAIKQQHVVHYLALSLNILGDVICPMHLGIP